MGKSCLEGQELLAGGACGFVGHCSGRVHFQPYMICQVSLKFEEGEQTDKQTDKHPYFIIIQGVFLIPNIFEFL